MGYLADNFLTGVNNAYKISQSTWQLFNGLAVPTLSLVLSVPVGSFKIAITLSTVAAAGTEPAHSDVTGDVYVNSEKISFTSATRKVAPTALTAIPVISTSGLDCNVLIECVSTTGAPLYKETLEDIEILCVPKTRFLRDASGSGYQQTDYDVYTEAALKIGDQIRYADPLQGTIDIYVKNVVGGVDIEDNTLSFRILNCA